MTKCKFEFGFLEGEMDVDDEQDEVFVTHINKKVIIDGVTNVIFDVNRGVIFRRIENNVFVPRKYMDDE